MKKHLITEEIVLQKNKKWSALKETQKLKIMSWLREETIAYFEIHGQYPMGNHCEDIVDNVYDKIQAADIWIPYGEVYQHYTSKKLHIINSLKNQTPKVKRYVDVTNPSFGCSAVYSSKAEIIPAGTTVYSMPVSARNDEYDRIAENWGIHFIFDDNIPTIDFYSVPRIDIFATDGDGGFFGTVGETSDFDGSGRIVYISPERTCYQVGQNARHFISKKKNWRTGMTHWKGFQFYQNLEAAKASLPFIDMPGSSIENHEDS